MDLQHYFNAVDFSELSEETPFNWKYSLGASIEKNTLKLSKKNLHKVEIALIGVPFDTRNSDGFSSAVPNLIRKQVYHLAGKGKINIVDFGNLKPSTSHKGNYLALRDVVDYLNELGIATIILGASQDYSYGICQAYRNNNLFSFCTIDAFLDVKKGKETFGEQNYLSRVFSTQTNIFQFSLLGYQSHYVANQYFSKTKGLDTHLRLGILRKDLAQAETIFRNSDFLSFDFRAIKHTDAPGKNQLPNGLYAEEACQLAKYAGLSNRLNTFALFGLSENELESITSVKLAAEIIWYFIDGFLKRSLHKPEEKKGFAVYKVEIANLTTPLVFYKHTETNKWWIEVESVNKEKFYFACSEKNYLQASQDEIPELWLKYIQKIDEILK